MAQALAGGLTRVGSGLALSEAERLADLQRENLAIAHGLKQNDPELLDRRSCRPSANQS